MQSIPDSLKQIIERNPILEHPVRGLPNLGENLIDGQFSKEVSKIYDAFELYGNDLYELENEKIKNISSRSLGGGSPMRNSSFPLCKEALINIICSDELSDYPMAAGDEESREIILEYIKQEGFKSNSGLSKDNIIFTVSSTHAFNIISSIIARPYDVILMTGPNYGLFTFVPERVSGATVEILPLSEDDNWYVNPQKLSKRIDDINIKLKAKYGESLGYTPKVVAFLNENPHNPLGKVMNENNKEILEGIGNVCLSKGVFVIDDLIYRDLTYDRKNLAKPMASYEKFFDNTITITGLSKSYGLASIRSGMVVANEIIIRAIRNKIFQTMDSSPVLQGRALAGAFNASERRKKEYDNYFNPVIEEYKYRLELMKALINGLDFIDDNSIRKKVENDIRNNAFGYNVNQILDGIPNVDFVNGTLPDSGFFEILDFTQLKNKVAENGRIISDEKELLKYMYEQEKIKLILGQSISWPNENQLIGRVTTALPREDLVEHFSAMNKCLRKLR
jgi:probable aspartate aminotransferase